MKKVIGIYGVQDYYTYKFPGFTHDHSVCVMENGRIIDYVHLERFSRRKYDNRLNLYIEELIDKYIKIDSDAVLIFVNSFAGNSFISNNGRLRFECSSKKSLLPVLEAGEGKIINDGKIVDVESYSISHELAHMGSCLPFFGPFRDNSLLVHFDGGASLGNFSAFLYRDEQLSELECHWELSHLSKLFNDNALSFGIVESNRSEHCSVPGKFMGFAAMGQESLEIKAWLRENDFFKNNWNNIDEFHIKAKEKFDWNGNKLDQHDHFIQNVAASLQAIFQEEFLQKLTTIQEKHECDILYLSGGCALNILTNSKIVESEMFNEVHIPPCCNDAGLSIGAAAMYALLSGLEIKLHHPFHNSIGCDIDAAKECNDGLTDKVSDLLYAGNIIGIANGFGEVGPRALGNRSILARADSKELAQKVSVKCKQREWYRPTAPVMLVKNAKYFTGLDSIHPLSAYMLLDFKILNERIPEIEGVVHQNNTSRIQTIFNRNQNPFLFDLLKRCDDRHGLKALINTSFNKKGEPIVHTKKDAICSAKEMGLDYIVIGGVLISIEKTY